MKCFVTGASGFVGANLVRELVGRGHSVRILSRPGADLRGIDGLSVGRVTGDITDKSDSLARLMDGCDWCFHVAASYALWLRDYEPMYAANVLGTQKIIRGAVKAGCTRIVYTSTVGCIGLPKPDAAGRIVPTDESTPVSEVQMSNHYKISKWRGEVAARQLAADGAPVVIVNPSAPIGPFDIKPTPTGAMIVDFGRGKMPAYLDTGLNWVHVRDVAIGHILAAEKGRIGERYILGNSEGNWTMKQGLECLAQLMGRKAPRWQIPYPIAFAAAQIDEFMSRFSGRPPRAPVAGVKMAKYKMWFNPAKAVRELGLPQTPTPTAFADAVAWFQKNNYFCPGAVDPRFVRANLPP